jgi:hypothetical protein
MTVRDWRRSVVTAIGIGCGGMAFPTTVAAASAEAQVQIAGMEQERCHDNQMWQLMRYLLHITGHAEKVSTFDALWARTTTPEQWIKLGHQLATNSFVTAASHPIARLCTQHQTNQFARVFQIACAASTNVAEVFTGLILWSTETGNPQLQGRGDWALHFIYGGATEAMLDAGDSAAISKEVWDQAHGRPYDLNDLAASMAGAAWVGEAHRQPDWQSRWASGDMNLDRSLPKFQYGQGEPSPAMLSKIRHDIHEAFQ